MVELDPIDYLNGPLSLIVVGISIYVGIHILTKYVQHKESVFLYVGLVAIITSEPWWPHVISLISVLTTGEPLSTLAYFLIGNSLIPVAILFWLMALIKLQYKDYKKTLISFGLIYLVAYELVFFFLLISDYELIGIRIGSIDVQYNLGMLVLLITALAIILPSGLMFAKESFRSEKAEIKMKGKFLMLAFISYCSGAAIDALILSNPFSLIIARTLLVTAAVGFLGGFVPPSWIKRLFLSQEN